MMSGILTADDLEHLTDSKRASDQRQWLDSQGIPYYVSRKGKPKVLWQDLEHKPRNVAREPDFSQLPRRG